MLCDTSCVQVPLLLSLGEHERALTKAIQAGDPDLVYLALFALQRSPLSERDRQAAIASKPLARNLYRAYCALTVQLWPKWIPVDLSGVHSSHPCQVCDGEA